MIDVDNLAEPGGVNTVCDWITDLYGHDPGRNLWIVLDDRLRLVLAQCWVYGALGHGDDDLAEELAADDANHRDFPQMLDYLINHWRHVYGMLRQGIGVLRQTIIVGADMELVVLTSLDHVGYRPAGVAYPAHSFVTRLEADDWAIAALARRLPVPGWPPSEEVIPGLGIDQ